MRKNTSKNSNQFDMEKKTGLFAIVFSIFYIIWRLNNIVEGESYLLNYIIVGVVFLVGLFLLFFKRKGKQLEENTSTSHTLSPPVVVQKEEPKKEEPKKEEPKKEEPKKESISLEEIEKDLKNAVYTKEEKKNFEEDIEFVEIEDILKKYPKKENVAKEMISDDKKIKDEFVDEDTMVDLNQLIEDDSDSEDKEEDKEEEEYKEEEEDEEENSEKYNDNEEEPKEEVKEESKEEPKEEHDTLAKSGDQEGEENAKIKFPPLKIFYD